MYSKRTAVLLMGWMALAAAGGCGSNEMIAPADGGAPACPTGQAACGGRCIDVTSDDENCGGCGAACTGAMHCGGGTCRDSNIQHVVLIVEENHTFDSYFGRYCTAPAGSNPSCTNGPGCCERAPDTEPHGASPVVLDDASNFATDRDHQQACELQQINGGKMDQFVTGATGADTCAGSGPSCASPNNFALAGAGTVGRYWALADGNALADRYFQPIAGGTASNDMYLAISHFQFVDNKAMPDTVGCLLNCSLLATCLSGSKTLYTGRTTIADLLLGAGRTFTVYAEGYADAAAAGAGKCPNIASSCQYDIIKHPIAHEACRYDASDVPFNYYSQFANGAHVADFYTRFAKDVAAGKLPSLAYIKAMSTRNEHPNVSNISDGIDFVTGVIQAIQGSPYASSTLILLTWDEGGGFFDHVAPPPSLDTDDMNRPVPYGTRVPMLAIGPFAKKGYVSHVQLEHSSIVRFLEYNFVGKVGQLGYSDAKVANIGSLLDEKAVGFPVPAN
ncbi:MAG: alkaline phosphatase family protein [Polyangia bacterium]